MRSLQDSECIGKSIYFKNIGDYNVVLSVYTLSLQLGDFIDGETTVSLAPNQSKKLIVKSQTEFITYLSHSLADASDVVLNSPSDSQFLRYDGSNWVNAPAPATSVQSLNDIEDVSLTSPADNDYLTWDSTSSRWVNSSVEFKRYSYLLGSTADANNVTIDKDGEYYIILAPTTASGLTFTMPNVPTGIYPTVTFLNIRAASYPVTITGADFYLKNGTFWENGQEVTSFTMPARSIKRFVKDFNTQKWFSADEHELASATDVALSNLTGGQFLQYNGSNWVNTTLATVATSNSYNDLSSKPTLGTASALDVGTNANQVVQLDGTGRLPAVDGSQLTNLPSSGGGASFTEQVLTANGTINDPSLTGGYLTVNLQGGTAHTLPALTSAQLGSKIVIINSSEQAATISTNSGSEIIMSTSSIVKAGQLLTSFDVGPFRSMTFVGFTLTNAGPCWFVEDESINGTRKVIELSSAQNETLPNAGFYPTNGGWFNPASEMTVVSTGGGSYNVTLFELSRVPVGFKLNLKVGGADTASTRTYLPQGQDVIDFGTAGAGVGPFGYLTNLTLQVAEIGGSKMWIII
jgi:hypothetical protein